jgi:Zn finger protein HypA/HybF involved in hydrogenase expression
MKVLGAVTVRPQELDVAALVLDLSVGALLDVQLAVRRGGTPVLEEDLLATEAPSAIATCQQRIKRTVGAGQLKEKNQFVLLCPQCLSSSGTVQVASANRHQHPADFDTGNGAVRLSPCALHARLEPIGPGCRTTSCRHG